MGVRIAFGVPEAAVLGDVLAEEVHHVPLHVGIPALVDGHAAGGVGAVDDEEAVDPAFGDVGGEHVAEGGGDVHHLHAGMGLHVKVFGHSEQSLALRKVCLPAAAAGAGLSLTLGSEHAVAHGRLVQQARVHGVLEGGLHG